MHLGLCCAESACHWSNKKKDLYIYHVAVLNTIKPSGLVVCSFSAWGLCSKEHSSLFVCLYVCDTKMSILSQVGKHAMCTHHSPENRSESVLRRARKQGSFYLFESSF